MDYGTFRVLEELRTRAHVTELTVKKILALLQEIKQQEAAIMATAQDILTAVQEETTVTSSIITLLDEIKAALDAAGTDAAMLDQVKAMIDTNKQAMADAVVRNTPAGP